MQIIKNFLPEEQYKKIKQFIFSEKFPWFYNKDTVYRDPLEILNKEQEIGQFIHFFYKDYYSDSPFINIISPFIEKINPISIFKIKLNLNYGTKKIIETGYHTDIDDKRFKSAVFFLNECDGYCKIKEEKIYSEDNKVVIFDSNTSHTGSTCTSSKRRVVLNMVYIDVK